VRGVEAAAREAGYAVLLSETCENTEVERHDWDVLRSRRVDGVLIACSDSTASFEHLKHARTPVVFFDRLPFSGGFTSITTAHELAARKATQHLIELGHVDIAAILGNLRLSTHAGRLRGFQRAMEEAALKAPPDLIRTGQQQIGNGYQFGLELLARSPRPTAVFCGNNNMLLGVFRALQNAGVKVPQEISLVGFDRNAWTENASPRITTIAQQTERIGREAFGLLLERIEARRARPHVHVELEAEFCLRESTSAPARRRGRMRP
jgi:DNA-binding LacI/PurR family transcriptional regulator